MSPARLLQMSGIVVDLVYRVDEVPKPGEEVLSEDTMITSGGGFNAMVAASRAGMHVSYGGSHGTGRFADIVRNSLSELRIQALQSRVETCDQGTTVVLVDHRGERTFVSHTGAERHFGSSQFGQVDMTAFEYVLISGYTFALSRVPEDLDVWLDSIPEGPQLVFDPTPVIDKIPSAILAKLMRRCSWISANADEARIITGIGDPQSSAVALLDRMGESKTGALVRHGEHGCWLALPGEAVAHVAAFEVEPVDTNGAGDTHIGSFIAALGAGDAPLEAVRFANAAAALSTLQNGPATAPERRLTETFMEAEMSRRDIRKSARI